MDKCVSGNWGRMLEMDYEGIGLRRVNYKIG